MLVQRSSWQITWKHLSVPHQRTSIRPNGPIQAGTNSWQWYPFLLPFSAPSHPSDHHPSLSQWMALGTMSNNEMYTNQITPKFNVMARILFLWNYSLSFSLPLFFLSKISTFPSVLFRVVYVLPMLYVSLCHREYMLGVYCVQLSMSNIVIICLVMRMKLYHDMNYSSLFFRHFSIPKIFLFSSLQFSLFLSSNFFRFFSLFFDYKFSFLTLLYSDTPFNLIRA